MKICNVCKLDLPLSKFHSNKHKKFKDGYQRHCSDCDKDFTLRRYYGITLKEYNKKFEEQNGLCTICDEPEIMKIKGKSVSLAVDHSHTSNTVRGLLCVKCNRALGMLRESKDILIKAVKYLDQYDIKKTS